MIPDPAPVTHIAGENCWCEPVLEYTSPSGAKVWVHRDLAHGTRPPPEVIAQAIIECLMDEEAH